MSESNNFNITDDSISSLPDDQIQINKKLMPHFAKTKIEFKKLDNNLNDIFLEEETEFFNDEKKNLVKYPIECLNSSNHKMDEIKFQSSRNNLFSIYQKEHEISNSQNNTVDELKSILNNKGINTNQTENFSNINSKNDDNKNNNIRKSIHFNLENYGQTFKNVNPNFRNRRRSSNLHDSLNQLKSDVIKRNKLKENSSPFKYSRGDKIFDCRKIKEHIYRLKFTKSSVYYLLECPVGVKGFIYRLFSLTIILFSILTGALTTIQSLDKWSSILLFYFEIFTTFYFAFELMLRIWSLGHRVDFNGFQGRLRYIVRPIPFVELLVIISSILILTILSFYSNKSEHYFKTNSLTLFRFVQILRILYIDRQAKTWTLLGKVVYKHRFELLTSVYIGVIILLFSSYLILIFEKSYSDSADDNHFHSFADAVYWSIITMTTIGYGDRSPRTFCGKIVATCLCIVGVAFWTLPGGIIGSGFALKVEQKNKKKQLNRLLPAAASLIQSWWRLKAVNSISPSETSRLIPTVNTFDISKPLVSSSRLKKNLDSIKVLDKQKNVFNGLDSSASVRSEKALLSQIATEDAFVDEIKEENNEEENLIDKIPKDQNNSNNIIGTPSDPEQSSILLQLSLEHLLLIRTILLLKYFSAKHKFKLAFKPYDFKDVIEQYTQGNMDILLKMKDLQRKIEQVWSMIANIRHASQYQNQFSSENLIQDKNSKFSNFANIQNSPILNQIHNHHSPKNSTISNPLSKSQFQNLNCFTFNQSHLTKPNLKINAAEENNFLDTQLNERLIQLETNMEKINQKLDMIISLSTK